MRAADGGPRPHSVFRWAAGSVLPSAVLVLMPKCPACVVVYVAMVSGVGISVSLAAHLRVMVLALCGAALVYFVAKALWRRAPL